jgi:hypothetical protein
MAPGQGDSEFVDLGVRSEPVAAPAPEAPIELRPRGAAEQVDLAVELLRGRAAVFLGVCTALWFPARAAMPWFVELTDVGAVTADEELGLLLAGAAGMTGMQTVVTLLSTGVVTVLAHQQLVGRPCGVGDALGRVARRLPGLFVVLLLQGLLVGLGVGLSFVLALLCPPFLLAGLVLYLGLTWKLWLAPSALVLEGIGPLAAIGRSWNLTDRAPLRWLGVFFLVSVLSMFFAGISGVGDNIELRDALLRSTGVPLAVFNTLFVGVSAVGLGISTALQAAAITIHYLDARIRREGLDLSMRLERLRVSGEEPAG